MQTEDLYRFQYGKEYIRKTISRLISSGDEAYIVGFDFQMPYLREYFGDNNGVEYYTVRET